MTEAEVESAMDVIRKELTDGLGKRCERFDLGCLTCAAWRAYDELDNALFQVWDARRRRA